MIKEKKNKRTALITTITIHGIILLLCFFIAAWQAPYPPIPEYGIELNFGLEERGTGEVQPDATQTEEQPEVTEDETNQNAEENQEENTNEDSQVETTDIESPDKVEEITEKTTSEQNEAEEKQKTDMSKEETNKSDITSQGDNIDKAGDKGDPEGEIEAKALYGNKGGGGGSLDMAGWEWDSPPNVKDQSSENGRIVFVIKVDDEGEIISVRTIEKTVSPAVEKIYKLEVEKLTFSRTSQHAVAAPTSSGKITFIIRSR
ncbi:MAG: hypothetical protein FVQ77_09990 [Cytophagales bacterium]|nr:hypothetical protein [Cytophagales bacterium]